VALVHDFFREMDGAWTGAERGKIRLRVIGCSALMLQTGYERGTKDSDVLEIGRKAFIANKRAAGRDKDLLDVTLLERDARPARSKRGRAKKG
jgi:hypothetical protein